LKFGLSIMMSPGSFPIGSLISHGQSNPATKIIIPIIIKVRCNQLSCKNCI